MSDKVRITFEFHNTSRKLSLVASRDSLTNAEWMEAIREGLNSRDTYAVIANDSRSSIIEFPSNSVFIITVKDEDAEDTTTV